MSYAAGHDTDGHYRLIRGALYYDTRAGSRLRVTSFCVDDPEQGPIVTLPIVQLREEPAP